MEKYENKNISAFIVNEKCNELGEKLQKYYVYKYII